VIFRRLILALAGASAFAASAAVCVVALAFALYALVQPYVGRAGAAAIVAGSAALIVVLAALFVSAAARPKASRLAAGASTGAVERAFAFVRQKPVIAIAASIAAGILAVRNPRYLGSVIRAFVEGRAPPRR